MKNQPLKEATEQACSSINILDQQTEVDTLKPKPVEVGGPKGPEPTRYGDWEQAGRCTDFWFN